MSDTVDPTLPGCRAARVTDDASSSLDEGDGFVWRDRIHAPPGQVALAAEGFSIVVDGAYIPGLAYVSTAHIEMKEPPAMSSTHQDTVGVDLGGRTVTVAKGGLFDRYRMDTDLDEVAHDPRVSGVDFFRRLPKTRVESPIGPTLTPNFYYRMSSARLTMLARSRAIRTRLPRELAPLEVAPGLGLVSVIFFRYDVCDIDFYTEAAVGVAVRPARHGRLGFVDLVAALKNDHLDSYVLSLPVNTDIAQVRGHDGYGFPKWVTELDVDIDTSRTTAHVANDAGETDLAFSAPTPTQTRHPSGERVSTLTAYTTINGAWHSTMSQTNTLSAGSAALPRGIDVRLGQGRMTDDLRSLKPIRTIRLDVMTEGQLALHMPVPYSVAGPSQPSP